jgi:hypothetical protein
VDLACVRPYHVRIKDVRLKPLASRSGTHAQKPLHSVYDCVQRNAGPHRCGALSVVREIIPPDVHRLALRRQQLLSNLARVRLQRGGYRSEALLQLPVFVLTGECLCPRQREKVRRATREYSDDRGPVATEGEDYSIRKYDALIRYVGRRDRAEDMAQIAHCKTAGAAMTVETTFA